MCASPLPVALGVALDLLDQPGREGARVGLAGRERRLDDEIAARTDDRLLERRRQRARLNQFVDERLAAERHALSGDRRLDHLLVLGKMQRTGGLQIADAE